MSDRPRIAGIGEVLWDRFPDGDRLGGAPANFAFHAGQLGAEAVIVSRIGRDADGDRIASTLGERGLTLDYLQRDPVHPTGIVRVELDRGQPSYVIAEPAAWDFLELTDALTQLAPRLDALCFGTLAQRHAVSRRTIQALVESSPKAERLFDLNLRQAYFSAATIEFGLRHASVLKCNEEELAQLGPLLGWKAAGDAVTKEIFARSPVELIAVTRGAEGCVLYTRKDRAEAPAPPIEFVDAVGAGDAFSAALLTGFLAGSSLDQIARRANRVGGYVASQAGAMPIHPPQLIPL